MAARPLVWTACLAALATAGLVLLTRVLPPEAAEGLLLRWMRTASAHPLRTGLALALVLEAWRPSGPFEERQASTDRADLAVRAS